MKMKKMTYQNLWDTAKAELRGEFRALNTSMRKEEKSQINNLSFCLKILGKDALRG